MPQFAGEPTPPLAGDTTADVVILGGGYTGLWTAWFLKERDPGIDVVLLEQDICGGGPSGRNGGFCDGWWGNLIDLVATYGEADALELLMHVGRSPSEIGAWCEANGVDAWFRMAGDLARRLGPGARGRVAAAARPRRAARRRRRVPRAHRRRGRRARALADVRRRDVHARRRQPAARAACARAAHRGACARRPHLRRNRRSRASGSARRSSPRRRAGSVRAGDAVIALGAWATWWRAFKPLLTVRGSYIVVTEPVPERLEAIGWTGGENVRDAALLGALPAHDARRADRVRARRAAARSRSFGRPSLRLRRAVGPAGRRRPRADVPRGRRRADRGAAGAARST